MVENPLAKDFVKIRTFKELITIVQDIAEKKGMPFEDLAGHYFEVGLDEIYKRNLKAKR